MNELRKAITAVAEHALVLAEHDRKVFRITGVDALDLLHRISTNDLLNSPVDQAITTVFCTEKGRVIESAEILRAGQNRTSGDLTGGDLTSLELRGTDLRGTDLRSPDLRGPELFMTCSAPGSQALLRWIDKFTITEDIHLNDVSDVFSTYCLIGPEAIQSTADIRSRVGHLWHGRFGSVPCLRILSSKETRPEGAGTLTGIPVVESGRTHEFLRVLHSVPLFGHEIVDAYNPYEVGLIDAISFTKGCYIGQEVIARLDTYKKVQRQLRMLWSDSSDMPRPGTPVVVAGEHAGIITSSTSGLGRTIALAVLPNDAIQAHEVYRINDFPYVLNDVSPPPYSLIFPWEAE